jgi:hypothetical protein
MSKTRTAVRRDELVEGVGTMLAWLEERPELPLPLHGAWTLAEDGKGFHVFTDSEAELDRLAGAFDSPQDVADRDYPGIRQHFGAVAYELLLDEDRWRDGLGAWRVDSRPDPVRSARVVAMAEMFEWLRGRPALPLPTLGAFLNAGEAEGGEDDLVLFKVYAEDAAEQEALLGEFDRVDRFPADLPSYVKPARRAFGAGVAFEVRLG